MKRLRAVLSALAAACAACADAAGDFRFESFSVSNGLLGFSASWPEDDPPPDGVVDLYCRTNLASGAVRILRTETAGAPPLAFSVDASLVPADAPVAFFRLGTRADADGDSAPDAWELQCGLDPGDPADSVRDDDGDGLANLHEFWHGADPHAPDGAVTALAAFARSVDDRLAGKAPATALPFFLGYPDPDSGSATNALAPNPDCWAADVDFSCESPWNSESRNRKSGTLVSPVHLLLAAHHRPPADGTEFWFRATNGTVHVRRLADRRAIAAEPDTDLVVALLDEPLPPDVVPAKILPPDFRDRLGTGEGLPAVSLDQEGKILVSEIADLAVPETGDAPMFAASRVPLSPVRAAFYETLVAGDSSNPKFLLLGDRPVLLSIHWTEDHAGASIRQYAGLVDAAMAELAPDAGYRLECVDLGRFPKLP